MALRMAFLFPDVVGACRNEIAGDLVARCGHYGRGSLCCCSLDGLGCVVGFRLETTGPGFHVLCFHWISRILFYLIGLLPVAAFWFQAAKFLRFPPNDMTLLDGFVPVQLQSNSTEAGIPGARLCAKRQPQCVDI